jgi:hypothetical protein
MNAAHSHVQRVNPTGVTIIDRVMFWCVVCRRRVNDHSNKKLCTFYIQHKQTRLMGVRRAHGDVTKLAAHQRAL